MIIVCPRCGILYGVDADALAADERTVRCSNCDREWLHTPGAALPDNEDALRLLAASFGRGGAGAGPSPAPTKPRAEADLVDGPPRREKAVRSPVRPRNLAVEAELAKRPAPVTALYPASADTTPGAEDRLSRGARLSSRQLDALLNGTAAGAGEADAPPLAPSAPELLADEPGSRRPEAGKLAPAIGAVAKPDAVLAVEPARALDTGPGDDGITLPPPSEDDADDTPRPSPPQRHRAALMAVAAVAGTLLVSVGLLAATRGMVLAAFPGAAGFYSALGLSAGSAFAEGLEIREVTSTRSWSDGEQILTVAGDLANVAEEPRDLPMVRVVLVDGSDAEVQEVVVVPPSETLPVGESIRFEARINNPADSAERIKVSLKPRPEPS